MGYCIYIGFPEEIGNVQEMFSFSKEQHGELFLQLRRAGISGVWLFEMQEYDEFMNYTEIEVKDLVSEIKKILEIDAFRDNTILNTLLEISEIAIPREMQLMGVGE